MTAEPIVPDARVVAALVDAVAPGSVLVAGCDGEWADAFRAAGVVDAESTDLPFGSAVSVDRHFDLAVCLRGFEESDADTIVDLVAALVRAADVVALAAPLPKLEPFSTAGARWPVWWHSQFAAHGYVPHDAVRRELAHDPGVDPTVRDGLVLYAPRGRLEHPSYARDAGDVDRGSTSARSLTEVDTQLLLAENDAARRRADAAVSRAGSVQAERERVASATSGWPSISALRTAPKRELVRLATAAMPVRRGLRRTLGPSAPLFDAHWYVMRYPDVAASAISPLWHYRRHGARMRRSPNPFFEAEWYLDRHPEVAAQQVDAFEYYLASGWRQGHDPHPMFSGPWYVQQGGLDGWRRSPLEHFIRHGRGAGRSPHPLLDPAWYLAVNPDVARSGVSPVEHFLVRGWWEGRSPHPLFDTRWYLETYSHVAGSGENPIVHYLRIGWREGNDPNPLFDVSWYLDAYPDVVALDVEPLEHYLTTGAVQRRITGPLFDTAWYVAAHPEAERAGRNPLEFFLTEGAARGDIPSLWAQQMGDWAEEPSQRRLVSVALRP